MLELKNTKVAIYGCSFADPSWSANDSIRHLAWPNLLKNNFGQVDNYAKGGSSVYYSYKKFLETHHNYDKIIFSITSPGRWFMPIQISGQDYFINSVETLRRFRDLAKGKLSTPWKIVSKLNALEQYYMHLEDADVSQDIQELIIFKMLSLRTNIVFVPWEFWVTARLNFYNNFTGQEQDKIHKLSVLDNNVCHLPEEYNFKIYQKVYGCLVNNTLCQWDTDEKIKINHPFTHYFKSA